MLEKIKNIKVSKKKYFVVTIFALIIVSLLATYAWWRWSSSINAMVYGRVCVPEINFVGGNTINGEDLVPVRTKEEGLTKDINVNLNNTCSNDTAVLNLNLVLEYFPEGLADTSFKWALYEIEMEEVNNELTEVQTLINNGNFYGKEEDPEGENPISLATDLIVTANVSTYRLYIWLDATVDNPSSVGGNTFRFRIYGTGKDAIYNHYTMKAVSSSSPVTSFWGSSINSNQVKSIHFVKLEDIPIVTDGEYDLSSVANSDDVTMYYVENGQTDDAEPITLYDVYVASNNGAMKTVANVSGENMFAHLINCEYIDAEGLDTSNMVNMHNMFYDTPSLEVVNVSNWDTKNVTNMSGMFKESGTSALTIDLSNFETPEVTTMASMFEDCGAGSIVVTNFSNDEVTTMNKMFYNASASSINLLDFYTPSVTNIAGMFYNCENVVFLDLSGFNTEDVTVFCSTGEYGMFEGCSSLVDIKFGNFDTSNATTLYHMFSGCSSLRSLDLSSFDTSNVTNMESMFEDCASLKILDVSSFDTEDVTTMKKMFKGAGTSGLIIDLSNFETPEVTTMASMFEDCGADTINLSNFSNDNVTTMRKMFFNADASSIILTNFETPEVVSMYAMFYGCANITRLDVSSFDTSNVTTFCSNGEYGMFEGCSSLLTLNLSNFNTENITTFYHMFKDCSSLVILNLDGFDTTNVTNMEGMFLNCSNLMSSSADYLGSSELSSIVDDGTEFKGNTKYVYNDPVEQPENYPPYLNLSSFDTSNVINMREMFKGCSTLYFIDLSSFDTSSVTTMESMFNGCTHLGDVDWSSNESIPIHTPIVPGEAAEIDTGKGANTKSRAVVDDENVELTDRSDYWLLKNFDTSSVTNMANMFKDCSNLIYIDLSHFNTSSVTTMEGMFSGCSKLSASASENYVNNSDGGVSVVDGRSSPAYVFLQNFDTSNVTTMKNMFKNCSSIESLYLPNFNTANVTTMEGMFSGCAELYVLDVSSFDTSNVTTMAGMFENLGRADIYPINLHSFTTESLTDISNMFYNTWGTVDLSNFEFSSITSYSNFFSPAITIDNDTFFSGFALKDCTEVANFLDMFDIDTENMDLDLVIYDELEGEAVNIYAYCDIDTGETPKDSIY